MKYIKVRNSADIADGKWLVNMDKGEGMCNKCKVRAKLISGIRYCPFCGIRVNTEVIRDVKDR